MFSEEKLSVDTPIMKLLLCVGVTGWSVADLSGENAKSLLQWDMAALQQESHNAYIGNKVRVIHGGIIIIQAEERMAKLEEEEMMTCETAQWGGDQEAPSFIDSTKKYQVVGSRKDNGLKALLIEKKKVKNIKT